MDLSALNVQEASSKPRRFVLRHPGTDEPTDVAFLVLGSDDPEIVAKNKELNRKRMTSKKRADDPYEEVQSRKREMVLAATVGWENFECKDEKNGLDISGEFSKDKLAKVIALPGYAFIADQIFEFFASRANFFD